jgi:hypothetical protein
MKNWKLEYRELGIAYKKKTHPVFYASEPNPERYVDYPKDFNANGVTKGIVNFLTWKGHHANRISTQGQARVKKIPKFNILSGKLMHLEKMSFTKSTTKKGTPDISAIVHGWAVMIEVKIGRDVMSEAQVRQKEQIEAAGGLYFIATNMQQFYDWYVATFEQEADPDLYTSPEGYE